jgi:hypothetical protein
MSPQRERLIRVFTFEKPFHLQYHRRGRLGENHKKDLPELRAMMKEGLVTVLEKTTKHILYRYEPQTKR